MKAVTSAAEEPRPVLCALERGTPRCWKRVEVDLVVLSPLRGSTSTVLFVPLGCEPGAE